MATLLSIMVYILSYSADNVKQCALILLHFFSFQSHCNQQHTHEKADRFYQHLEIHLYFHTQKKILMNIKDLYKGDSYNLPYF